MKTDYNPVKVVEQLLDHQAYVPGIVTHIPPLQLHTTHTHSDVNQSDQFGRSPLHLIASSSHIHATKMVSLLLEYGSHVGES